MKKFISVALLLIQFNFFAQGIPHVQLKDATSLKLSSLIVDVKITGNFATTTYKMKFYNGLDRTLEGELAFPLGEGQAVSEFAMDVSGVLRKAVVVEKELARVAYENTIKQKIDPGLLEKTQGNNYKARIYPILPKSYKEVLITYEEELTSVNKALIYELPLGIKTKLDFFAVNIEVFGETKPFVKENSYKDLLFQKSTTSYIAANEGSDVTPNKPIIVQIPTPTSEEVLSFRDYFYIYKTLEPNVRTKSKPKKISLLWDISYSLKYRDITKEIALLDQYFNYLQNVEVHFISFSNSIHQNRKFKIKKGDWNTLKQLLLQSTYDGGTALNLFDKTLLKTDECLLFSDGLDNLGCFSDIENTAVYTINSMGSANHESLQNIATKSGGSYVNLLRLPTAKAVNVLKQETYQFLGVTHNDTVQNIFPNSNTNVTADFSLAGRFTENTQIELLFGYKGKITKRIPVFINKATGSPLIKRLWAKKKLVFLNKEKEANKKEIISLAKEYQLITDYSSMLILDRIDDYVRYKIEPPAELRAEYKSRIVSTKEQEANKREEIEERRKDLFDSYKSIDNWYATSFPKKEPKKKKVKTSSNTTSQTRNTQSIPQQEQQTTSSVLNGDERIISGVVTDESGESLPGVNVLVQGTIRGTETDFDGRFSIYAKTNDVLLFSYIGMEDLSLIIGNSHTYNVQLIGGMELDEVVITAMGIKTEKQTVSYSVSRVSSQSLESTLTEKVSGIAVESAVGASTNVMIRGASTNLMNSGNKPLFVVDGITVTENSFKEIPTDNIQTIQVLKPENATALFGYKAVGGVMIITTKSGIANKDKAITELNEQIVEKIELKSWNPNTPYIPILEKEKTNSEAYVKYLEIRNSYANSPSFFIDVADFFDKKGNSEIAIRVLSNLTEIALDDYELLKALAYKLEYFKQYKLAVVVYKKILDLRPEEPQSYRDLALAYVQNKDYQASFDLLYQIYNGDLLHKDEAERFEGIEEIAYIELTRLIHTQAKHIKLTETQKNLFPQTLLDMRIVIDWNHNDTDIDLWVIDPNGEKAYYGHKRTKIGGHMSDDMIDGYGPEEFMLKKAIKGKYKVKIKYYADSMQKISGPTILKISFFTHYGQKDEERATKIVRLGAKEDVIDVGELFFEK